MSINNYIKNNKFFKTVFGIFVFIGVKVTRAFKARNHFTGNQIAVICFHKLGDSVFTIPALEEIRRFFKKDFYILCFEENKPVYELLFNRDYIITFQHNDFKGNNRVAGKSIRQKLAEINPEYIFDLTGSIISASILYNSKAKQIIGLSEPVYKPVYTHYVPLKKNLHMIDMYIEAVSPVIPVSWDTHKEYKIEPGKGDYILIHPFAGWTAKEWNLNKFIRIAEILNEKYRVMFVSEPGRLNWRINNPDIKVVETKHVSELIDVIKNSSLLIANDSGPVHLAALLGRPTFTIYGPTNPVFHIPFGEKHRFVQKSIKCSPVKEEKFCFTNAGRDGCPVFDCMNMLTVEEVYNKVTAFISEIGIEAWAGKTNTSNFN